MGKIDDVLDKLEEVMEKLGEIETEVNTDSNYYDICAHCSGASGGSADCPYCNGTGLRLHGRMQKVED